MQALFFMNFVRMSNEGTRRIRDTMEEMNLPSPEFAQRTELMGFDTVRVTLRNNTQLRNVWVDSEAGKALNIDVRKLSQDELRIVNYAAEYDSINVTQAQKLLSKRWEGTKKALMKLVDSGILEHHHSSTVHRDAHACFTIKTRL